MSVVVVYDIACSWEMDYVQKDILKDIAMTIRFVTTDMLRTYTRTTDQSHYVLVFSSNTISFVDLRPVVERLKPHIIIHLSDEWGTKPDYLALADMVPLVLRQHHFTHYPPKPNIHHIPLGYMKGFPTDVPILPMHKRDLTWAFIGTVNFPRRNMLETLAREFQKEPSFVRGGGVKVQDMAMVYARAKFVPNERGAVRLDCFRIYEALKVGAIPVIVGTNDELEDTFGKDAPWVVADTWTHAVSKCAQLLANPQQLQELQNTNLRWFSAQLCNVRKHVQEALLIKT